jgi:hypothetical protein
MMESASPVEIGRKRDLDLPISLRNVASRGPLPRVKAMRELADLYCSNEVNTLGSL